ncbi:MAG TPA: HNH endonuclease, partial [Thermoanaerobaculia bacterium]
VVDLSEQKPGEAISPKPVTRQLELHVMRTPSSPSEIRELTKSFGVATVQQRLYEARFRNVVLDAYRDRCAVCGLHIRALIDAAHVGHDRTPKAAIDVREGIALCATHHRAFDAKILRYDEDYAIRIALPRASGGEGEIAMLLAYDGKRLLLPAAQTDWPCADDSFPSTD